VTVALRSLSSARLNGSANRRAAHLPQRRTMHTVIVAPVKPDYLHYERFERGFVGEVRRIATSKPSTRGIDLDQCRTPVVWHS
jgi:hypothetical protein